MKRVLIVDDEGLIRTLLSDVLHAEGYAVSEASNGLEALSEVERVRPDAIVLDVMMPLMDGPSFVRACHQRSLSRSTPIVLMSASPALWRIAEQLRRFGVRGFISKPFDLNVLISAVNRVAAPAEALPAFT
jgi:CheY-like chemotaxis protein